MKKFLATLGTIIFIAGFVLGIFGVICLIESGIYKGMVKSAESDMMSSYSEMTNYVNAT